MPAIPSDTRPIPLAVTSFDEAEEREVLAALRSGWVAQGPRVGEFETRFAGRLGAMEAVAMSSCTTALFLALDALGIGPGDEVIVPSLSFIASTNAVVHCGARPVFADVDPRTYNLDPERVAQAVGPRVKAIMAVHQVGLPCDLDAIVDVAASLGVSVLEDAACAVGSLYKGRTIGDAGTACFSFHPRKVLCTGEGGMIVTDDPELASRVRRLRHQGMSVSDLERHRANVVTIEEYPEVGYNFRMSDIHAAIGLAQLEKLDGLIANRQASAARYDVMLAREPRIVVPHVPEGLTPNYQSYLVRLEGVDARGRNEVIQILQDRGVSSRRGLMAAHREAPYRDARCGDALPHSELATDQTLCIPMHAELDEATQERVSDVLCEAVNRVAPS